MKNNKKGYTLIEMVVVIAIIVLLAGVGMYGVVDSIKDYKAQAEVVADHNQGFEGGASAQIGDYRTENPPGVETATPKPTATATSSPTPTPVGGGGGDETPGGDIDIHGGESNSIPTSAVNCQYASWWAGHTGAALVSHGSINVSDYAQVIITVRTIGTNNKTFTKTLTGDALNNWQWSAVQIEINDENLSGVQVVSITGILKPED